MTEYVDALLSFDTVTLLKSILENCSTNSTRSPFTKIWTILGLPVMWT